MTTAVNPLIERLEKAFEAVIYPGDNNLTVSTYGEEPAALVETFRDKTDWHALSAAFLDQAPDGWGSALSFFSAAALQFYLPAYLIADIRGELKIADPAIRLCAPVTPSADRQKIAKPWGGGTLGQRNREAFALFDAQQASAIVAYLRWKLEIGGYQPTIEQALEYYWSQRGDVECR